MKSLAYLSPAAWAMHGYLALISSHASAVAILPDVAAMLLFAVAFSTLGILRLRPQLLEITFVYARLGIDPAKAHVPLELVRPCGNNHRNEVTVEAIENKE